MIMNILIIEDDTTFIDKLKHDLLIFFSNYNDRTCFSTYHTKENSIPFMKFQIAFLDIDLESSEYTGIDIATKIRSSNPFCYIVFISAKNDLIHSTFKIQPFFFIRKSNYNEDFDVFCMLFKDKIKKKDMIEIEYLSVQQLLNIYDIVYIKAINHCINLYTKNGMYEDNHTLKSFYEILPKEIFVQIHRSIIINIDYLIKRTNSSVILSLDDNKTIELEIGRKYKDNFNKSYMEMLLR